MEQIKAVAVVALALKLFALQFCQSFHGIYIIIAIIVTIDGREDKLELKSPMIVNGMLVEKEQKYLIDFMWNKNRPNESELCMISIVD